MTKRYLDQRLKIRHLRVLDAIGAHGSLLRAANALNLTQPALTKSLREMEALMEARLFDRHSKGVTPNAVGLRVLAAARTVLVELNRLDKDLEALLRSSEAPIVVAGLPAAAAGVLPGVIARLRAENAATRVNVVQGRNVELLSALALGEVDLIVGRLYEPTAPDDFERIVLYDEPLTVVAGAHHPLFALDRVTIADLARYPFTLPTCIDRSSEDIDRHMENLGLGDVEVFRVSSPTMTRELLLTSDTVAMMPRSLMAGDLLRGELREAPGFTTTEPRPAGVIVRRDRKILPTAETFMSALKDYVSELGRLDALPPKVRQAR